MLCIFAIEINENKWRDWATLWCIFENFTWYNISWQFCFNLPLIDNDQRPWTQRMLPYFFTWGHLHSMKHL
jgi:hypothetical protein